ncbi:MAG: polysaccharide deacetylase family protein [Candidatus Marinimicrobia bacterium]|nr:polysaccharide deacetylase family protein [Candidatus Neomarinimicrobiota bacterium]MCF7829275.1 polysaccharide deacetylase family protein [Candidatus Neomarinimicrobiota bacterium]MCF7881072.1 polysaccharide deacetylase family protein [Candidatus Neomarinimicrobiota bacterium]
MYTQSLWRSDAQESVAVTFDDGPGRITRQLLDWATQREAQFAFFLMPENLSGHEPLVRQMTAEGHIVGTHFLHHRSYLFSHKSGFQSDLRQSGELISTRADSPVKICRPPYGRIFPWQQKWIRELGMTPVMWTHNTADYRPQSLEETCAQLRAYLRPGDIVVMHDGRKYHPEALSILDFIIDEMHLKIRFPLGCP